MGRSVSSPLQREPMSAVHSGQRWRVCDAAFTHALQPWAFLGIAGWICMCLRFDFKQTSALQLCGTKSVYNNAHAGAVQIIVC